MRNRGTIRAHHERISRYGVEVEPDEYTILSTPNADEVELGNVLEWEGTGLGEQVYRNVSTGRNVVVSVLHHGVMRAQLQERMGGY
jgi:hypothetical protein